jgi:choline kinase
MTYSDIVFTDSVAQKLEQAEGDICVVVDRDFRRGGGARPNHPFEQVEAVGVEDGVVSRIGKMSCGSVADSANVYGEFIGLLKAAPTSCLPRARERRPVDMPQWV